MVRPGSQPAVRESEPPRTRPLAPDGIGTRHSRDVPEGKKSFALEEHGLERLSN